MRTLFAALLFFTLSGSAQAATLYYNAAVNTSWTTLGNWWQDFTYLIPASGLPQAGDTVYIDGHLLADVPTIALAHLYAGVYDTASLINVTLGSGVTADATFRGYARINTSTTVNGNVTFYDRGSSRGAINGNAVYMNASSSRMILTDFMGFGAVTGTVTDNEGNGIDTFILRDNAWFYEGSVATGTMAMYDNSVMNGTFSGPITLYNYAKITSDHVGDPVFYNDAFLDDDVVITGDPVFNDNSYNYWGTINGNPIFNDNSWSEWIINGNPTFNDSSQNKWTINGDATFVGDASENTSTINGTKTRRYESATTTTRNFVATGPWTVVASGAAVDVSGATYDTTTTFLAQDGGSFVPEVAPTLAITAPASAATVTSWSPSISWGNATTCSYAYGNDSYSSVTCASAGSDIPEPSEGSVTLNLRALNATGTSTRSVSFTYDEAEAAPEPEPEPEPEPAPRLPSGSRSRAVARASASSPSASVSSPIAPAAQTVSFSSKEVEAFIALIQKLISGPASPSPVSPTLAPVEVEPSSLNQCPNMEKGAISECVRMLQAYLNKNGFAVASEGAGSTGNETTVFGPATEAALKRYQEDRSIRPASGFFGPLTRASIK